MKENEVEDMLNNLNIPEPENLMTRRDFKIPLLSFKRSSKAGLWLLAGANHVCLYGFS
jgi:hypothetical protein